VTAASAADAAATDGGVRSYYGQPVIKEPVWTPEIPTYFYAGGLAGASAGLAFGAGLRGNDELARRAWAIALGGVAVSPVLLISDLGRPARFLNMLRMFKVTSPMSVGSWILSGSGATTSIAALNAFTGLFPGLARVARPAAALLGLPLSTYTGALIANTAVPVWHDARRTLPFAFAGGAAMSAGAAAVALTPPEHAAAARRLALIGWVAETTGMQVMTRGLGDAAKPYHHGPAKALHRVAQAATMTGGSLVALRAQRSRPLARLGGALLSVGALAVRWSVFRAGFQSARDPAQVVGPQRERIERGQTRGAVQQAASAV